MEEYIDRTHHRFPTCTSSARPRGQRRRAGHRHNCEQQRCCSQLYSCSPRAGRSQAPPLAHPEPRPARRTRPRLAASQRAPSRSFPFHRPTARLMVSLLDPMATSGLRSLRLPRLGASPLVDRSLSSPSPATIFPTRSPLGPMATSGLGRHPIRSGASPQPGSSPSFPCHRSVPAAPQSPQGRQGISRLRSLLTPRGKLGASPQPGKSPSSSPLRYHLLSPLGQTVTSGLRRATRLGASPPMGRSLGFRYLPLAAGLQEIGRA